MSHDVDDRTETADPFVVPVYFPPLVVVEFGAHLNRRGGSYVTYHFRAEQDNIINFACIYLSKELGYRYIESDIEKHPLKNFFFAILTKFWFLFKDKHVDVNVKLKIN